MSAINLDGAEILIGGQSHGLRGNPGIVVEIPAPLPIGRIILRMTLEDAENIAEKMLEAVRRLEEAMPKREQRHG